MKKMIFALLAFAMPFIVSAQVTVTTLGPQFESESSLVLHAHVYDAGLLEDGDTLELRFIYAGPGMFGEIGEIYITNESNTHFEAPLTGLLPGMEVSYEGRLYNPGEDIPIAFGGEYFTETNDLDFQEPEVETEYATSMSSKGVSLFGEVEEYGGYSTVNAFSQISEDPYTVELTSSPVVVTQPYGDFGIDFWGLKPEKLYHYWQCASNPTAMSCGDREFFNTTSPGPVDISIYEYEQIGTCSMEIFFSVNAGNRPDQLKGEFRVGNPGAPEGAFYTAYFNYDMDLDNDMSLVIDYAPIVMAGIDLNPTTTVFSLRMDSYGILGKVSGKLPFEGEACNEEFEFVGEGDDARMAGQPIIKMYPNPTTEKIFIQNEIGGSVRVYTLLGKVVETYTLEPGINEIYVKHLSEGTYLVSFTGEDGTRTNEKIVIN
ncbi:MAG: T9SS type A sorting domain-containing protein [Candidatus Pacebacteria bacterium]|jgi:hypothetical protein|nr:T9SS type A sorting domain-containing protein [Candidatus Paceibacterota bacterium]MBP9058491.1 T9SS type A sorting domain-containing protein [Candidatus Paceibacterota bacterium]MBP9770462.1 T9SS type A sorting domain-containing protein [Candidatus Paceibacterota bacterium]